MSRLIDLLFDRRVTFGVPIWWVPPPPGPDATPDVLDAYVRNQHHAVDQGIRERQLLQARSRDLQVIEATAVADYYHASGKAWDLERDFPNLAPPFRRFWIEWRRPRVVLNPDDPLDRMEQFGVHFEARDRLEVQQQAADTILDAARLKELLVRMEDDFEVTYRHHAGTIEPVLERHALPDGGTDWEAAKGDLSPYLVKVIENGLMIRRARKELRAGNLDYFRDVVAAGIRGEENVRWYVNATLYAARGHHLTGPACQYQLRIGPGGENIGTPAFGLHSTNYGRPISTGTTESARLALGPALLAISLVHCRNVELEEKEPDEALQKARRSRGQRPLHRYHVLNIVPFRQAVRAKGKPGAPEPSAKQGLHIMRGHFKEFGGSSGKGKLFGKHEGTFWWADTLRGAREEGVVQKDYRMKGVTDNAGNDRGAGGRADTGRPAKHGAAPAGGARADADHGAARSGRRGGRNRRA